MEVLDEWFIAFWPSIFLLTSHGRFSLLVAYGPSITQAEIIQSEELLVLVNKSTWIVVFSILAITENFVLGNSPRRIKIDVEGIIRLRSQVGTAGREHSMCS